MPQVLTVNVPIQIPEKYKLVENSEYTKLQAQSLTGRTWLMADLRDWCGKKSPTWIKDNILFNPKYSRDMQTMIDHGYLVRGGRGNSWKFKASVMAEWLDQHWNELPW